jgi:CRP/FNR family transcriptional regulator, dissimilatory nitrate respiration regulator
MPAYSELRSIYYFYIKIMDYSSLADAPLFKGMTSEAIQVILGDVPFRVRKFQATAMLAQSGETVHALMIVLSGIVKGEMVDYAGRVIKIEDIPAPGVVASAFLFGKQNRFPVNVSAISAGEMLLIEKPDFLKMLKKNDLLLINFMDMISNRSQFLTEKIKFLNFKTIKEKLAYFILQKAGKQDNLVALGMTQNELGEFFGVARPSVARALHDLEEKGYIKAKGKNIRIIDKRGLAGMIPD